MSEMGEKLPEEKAPMTPPSPIIATDHEAQAYDSLTALGYTPELRRNRSLFTLLFQTLAIAAIPFGEGGPLISAIYGGGQLSIVSILRRVNYTSGLLQE
jgi:hypothetical protein